MLRTATLEDIKEIHNLISLYASDNLMLSRTLNEICEHIRDFVVFIENEVVVGCCALQIYMDELAEIKSLAVKQKYQNKGIGTKLVKYNLEQASNLKVKKVFVLTYKQHFFTNLGLKVIDKKDLPQKIWRECIKCHKFPNCDEIAMIKLIR